MMPGGAGGTAQYCMEDRRREEKAREPQGQRCGDGECPWAGASSGRSEAVRKKGSNQRASHARLSELRFDWTLPLTSWVIWASHLASLGLSFLFVKWL